MSDRSTSGTDSKFSTGEAQPLSETLNAPDLVLAAGKEEVSGTKPSGPVCDNDTGLCHEDMYERGRSYFDQFRHHGELNDIKKAIEYVTFALESTPDDHPDLPNRYASLGVSFIHRFQRLGQLEDLEKAITYYSRGVDLTPDDHPHLQHRHTELGVSYHSRFQILGELNDLEKAIEYYSRAFDLTPNDLEKAIDYYSRALDLTPDGHPDLPARHASLGVSYTDRFQRLGQPEDLEKAIKYYSCALKLTPGDHLDLPRRHTELGVCYHHRFQALGELDDLEKATKYYSRALDLTPDGHPDLPRRHSDVGASYADRFQRLGELNDLDKAIQYYSHTLDSTPNGHPDLPYRHASLGVSYTDRFRRLGQLDDLEKAIAYYSHALELTPRNHPDLPRRHTELGVSYHSRFQILGELNDLEKTAEYYSRALDLTPDGHPDLPRRHADLGGVYNNRFHRLGELKDLEKAIDYYSRALDLTPDGHPDLPTRHAGLGVSYTDRFRRLGQSEDLENAIKCHSHALDLTPRNHPDLPRRHTELGVSYHSRFQSLDELDDLERATKYHSRAIDLTPDGHPDLPRRHADLGVSYNDRFKRLGGLNDLKKAIEHESRALDLTHDGHPDWAGYHFNLAMSHLLHYQHTNDPSHLNYSLDSFRKASQVLTGSPRNIFQHALAWATHASTHTQLNCLEAYQATIDLLPQFIWLGATTNQRYEDLSMAESLAVNAASAAIRHSRYTLALEWLEQARCVVWNQSLMLRSPPDKLQSSYPDLANRLQTVSTRLNHLSSEAHGARALIPGSVNQEQVGQQRRRLAKEYHELLAEIRKLPGFEDFLHPIKSHGLVRAARNGPIVVINCHEDFCDALIIMSGQDDIKHLSLPSFTKENAQNARSDLEASLRHKGLRHRGFKLLDQPKFQDRFSNVLLDLWKYIVKPILNFLGFTHDVGRVSIDNLPHITWCPTGALTFLPLHAAGDYDQPRSRVFDYVISSYTPTLTALLASPPSTLVHATRVLAIGQAETPRCTPLPDDQATIADVLDAMEQHEWVHLACHAHQNVTDPTKSGFFLHDGTLDLASINQRMFRNKGLAFLSACQTATGHERLPDEAIHLASGMLTAGYPSVIATMWSVRDEDAPFVADKVYAELMKDGKVGNGQAGKALHHAVAELRDKIGENKFERWVPYIHIDAGMS
ncbi:hypothetical protein OPQ81_005146 [Rhizoctonia solani]|nr:hypothetical protein OPQ81_005146 [Rhizoctonia solani]